MMVPRVSKKNRSRSKGILATQRQEEPEEVESGQGEVEMTEWSTNLMQKQLSELAQQIVLVIQACNEEKDILEEDFASVRNGILNMKSALHTEKIRIDSEVQGVGSMMQFQQAVLEEVRSGIQIFQEQNSQIVGETTDLFAGILKELEAYSKKSMDNSQQVFAKKVSIQAVQKSIGILGVSIHGMLDLEEQQEAAGREERTAEQPEEQTMGQPGERTAEQPEEQTVDPPEEQPEEVHHHHHRIHRHLIMEEQEAGGCHGANDELRNWNSPNPLRLRNL
jgi:hypothetical protein